MILFFIVLFLLFPIYISYLLVRKDMCSKGNHIFKLKLSSSTYEYSVCSSPICNHSQGVHKVNSENIKVNDFNFFSS